MCLAQLVGPGLAAHVWGSGACVWGIGATTSSVRGFRNLGGPSAHRAPASHIPLTSDLALSTPKLWALLPPFCYAVGRPTPAPLSPLVRTPLIRILLALSVLSCYTVVFVCAPLTVAWVFNVSGHSALSIALAALTLNSLSVSVLTYVVVSYRGQESYLTTLMIPIQHCAGRRR